MYQSLNPNKAKTSLMGGLDGLLSRLWRPLGVKSRGGSLGQSLVEMAIAAPLLLLMFLGVFEVGWALRGYMVLANANREAVRFAVKTGTLNFSVKDAAQVGYHKVLSHTTVTVARQLPLEFLGPNPNATIIMSHFVIDTGFPCVRTDANGPIVPYQVDPNCDCTVADVNHPQWFRRDDLVLHPNLPGYAYYAQTYGLSRTTRLGGGNYGAEVAKLILENDQFNCVALQSGSLGETSLNNIFVSEMMYDQPQLLGAPLISNPLTNPIPFYAHTAMRLTISRDASATDTIGPVCELYPISFAKQIFANPDSPAENTALQLYQAGSGAPAFNWVVWNPARSNDARYLVEALYNPRLSLHDYVDPLNGDTIVSTNEPDRLAAAGSTAYGSSTVGAALGQLVNKTIRVPVINSSSNQIEHIALLNVTSVVTGANRQISGAFIRYDDTACEQ